MVGVCREGSYRHRLSPQSKANLSWEALELRNLRLVLFAGLLISMFVLSVKLLQPVSKIGRAHV